MSSTLVALMFGAGIGGWAYAQLARRVGAGNQRNAFIGAAVAAVIAFLFFFTLLKYIFNL